MSDDSKSFRMDDEHGKETISRLMSHHDDFINSRAKEIYQRLIKTKQNQSSHDNTALTQANKQPPKQSGKNPLTGKNE